MQKGGNVSLTKLAKDAGNPLRFVVVGCGWTAKRSLFGPGYDLDLSAAALDANGMVPYQQDPTDPGYQDGFVFANHRCPAAEYMRFMGDNRTGSKGGRRTKADDEQIKLDLAKVPDHIERIVFQVVIWQAEERKQKFGNVEDAFIRIFDETTGEELVRFDIGAEFSEETLVVFGELYRRNGEWKFRAIGQGYNARAFRAQHGIDRPFEREYARYND
ncbi:MAG: TerD family protein [Candidatus Saccharibacteria bacterium]